jgi:hypothetical protein
VADDGAIGAPDAADGTTDGSSGAVTTVGTTTIGVTGQPWRATVSARGAVTLRGAAADRSTPTLDWYVAADDRWHVPAAEPSVRQRRIDGTPVVETRLRVPAGDVVQRVWAVPDHGGLVAVELEDESPLPVAIALTGPRLVTERPPSDAPVRGIDLPADAILLPLGHRATVRVGLAVSGAVAGSALSRLPGATTVSQGWRRVVDRASRLDLPDATLVDAVVAARCDLQLAGPVDRRSDPVGHLLDVAELVRSGDDAERWLPHVVAAAEAVARVPGAPADAALVAFERIARSAGDGRAAGDAARIRRDRRRRGLVGSGSSGDGSLADLRRDHSVGRFVHGVERRLVAEGDLLPLGLPNGWLGVDFEVRGVPTGPAGSISFAVRWHGPRPAVLWEQHGEPVELRASAFDPAWSSSARAGEALWAAPRRARPLGVRAADD